MNRPQTRIAFGTFMHFAGDAFAAPFLDNDWILFRMSGPAGLRVLIASFLYLVWFAFIGAGAMFIGNAICQALHFNHYTMASAALIGTVGSILPAVVLFSALHLSYDIIASLCIQMCVTVISVIIFGTLSGIMGNFILLRLHGIQHSYATSALAGTIGGIPLGILYSLFPVFRRPSPRTAGTWIEMNS